MVHQIWQEYPEIEKELTKVKQLMQEELRIKSPEIRQKIIEYIEAPGKYFRAGLCLFFALIKEGQIRESKVYLATAIELFHLATLIHDDVIDKSPLRRNIETIHVSHSNRLAIYAGDYLMVMAGRLLSKSQDLENHQLSFDWAIEGVLEGEIQQLVHQYDDKMTMKQYLSQIRGKTGLLFALSCYAGYYSKDEEKRINKRAFYIGEKIGMVFQITDDLIDYQITSHQSGKPQMQDIRNGIYAAPILYSLNKYPNLLKLANQNKDSWSIGKIDDIYQKITNSGGLSATKALIKRYKIKIFKSISLLPGNEKYRKDLLDLLELVFLRNY